MPGSNQAAAQVSQLPLESSAPVGAALGFIPVTAWVNWEALDQYPLLAPHTRPLIEKSFSGLPITENDLIPPRHYSTRLGLTPQAARNAVSQTIRRAVMHLKCIDGPLKRDPDYACDPSRDIPAYIARWSSTYTSYVQKLAEQLPPMNPQSRTAVAIPAAAHEESGYLLDTLNAFRRQTERPDLFELVVFLNYPAACSSEEINQVHTLVRALEGYISDHPDQRIVYMRASLAGPRIETMGFIRSLLADALLWRAAQTPLQHDLILVMCDADTRAVTDRYIENFRSRFDDAPHTDAFMGRLRWSPEHSFDNPLIFVNQRLAELIDEFRRQRGDAPPLGGPVAAIRSSVFATVGGYAETAQIGEDVALSRALRQFRSGSALYVPQADAGPASRLFTSARRADAALHQGNPVSHQWNTCETSFGLTNAPIRSPGPSISLAPTLNSQLALQGAIQTLVNRTMESLLHDDPLSANNLGQKLVEAGLNHHLGIEVVQHPNSTWEVINMSRFSLHLPSTNEMVELDGSKV
jgi:hypothetical protein